MGKTSKKNILKYSEKTSKKALSSVNKGLKKVGKTSKYVAKAAVPVVEKGVSEVYGTMACATPSDTDFTAYEDLTYEQVCAWLEAGIDVEALDTNLAAQIEYQKNPPIVNLPLPWNK